MTKRKLTPLQRQMYSVKSIRAALRMAMAERSGAPQHIRGLLWQLLDEIIKDAIIADLTDNRVRDFLYAALFDSSTPPEDRMKVEKILHLR